MSSDMMKTVDKQAKSFELKFKYDNLLFVIRSNKNINDVTIDYYELADCSDCPDFKTCNDSPIMCPYHDYMDVDELESYIKENYSEEIEYLVCILNSWFNCPQFIIDCIQEKIDLYETE